LKCAFLGYKSGPKGYMLSMIFIQNLFLFHEMLFFMRLFFLILLSSDPIVSNDDSNINFYFFLFSPFACFNCHDSWWWY